MREHCKQICTLGKLNLFLLALVVYVVVEHFKNIAPNSLEACKEFLTLDPEIQEEDLVFSGGCKMYNYSMK